MAYQNNELLVPLLSKEAGNRDPIGQMVAEGMHGVVHNYGARQVSPQQREVLHQHVLGDGEAGLSVELVGKYLSIRIYLTDD